jgi:hypothetical protein
MHLPGFIAVKTPGNGSSDYSIGFGGSAMAVRISMSLKRETQRRWGYQSAAKYIRLIGEGIRAGETIERRGMIPFLKNGLDLLISR